MQLRAARYFRGGWALPDNVSCVCLGSTWVELDANIWPTGGGGRHGLGLGSGFYFYCAYFILGGES